MTFKKLFLIIMKLKDYYQKKKKNCKDYINYEVAF